MLVISKIKIDNKKLMLLPFLLCVLLTVHGQKTVPKAVNEKVGNEYAAIDNKVLKIPDSLTRTTSGIAGFINANFVTSAQKARAIFVWVAANIQYDIDNMFAINFYETKEDRMSKALNTRKGICNSYASLFTDIWQKSGLKSLEVAGYTKQNGFADFIPHAWCATLIDSTWLLFDPTWGSGYMSDNKFYKKINNDYFKANPLTLLKTHMPFDYLCQFVNYPITNQEFYEGKTQPNKSKPYFNYKDSISAFEKQTHVEQLKASSYRIEKNGVKNALIFDRLQHLKLELENDRQNSMVNHYNAAVADYNEGIRLFNDFVQYRNKQFTPAKTDAEIQAMVDAADKRLGDAKKKLSEIKYPDANITTLITQLTKTIDDAVVHGREQQDWLKTYFTKGKSGRKSMFYDRKLTWFGIPIN